MMAEESTEALARSQLETLYRLGILERSSDDVELGQPRQNVDSRLNQRHEAFLAALPPPAAIHSMNNRPSPFLTDDSNSSRASRDDRSSEYYSESGGGALSNSLRTSRSHCHSHLLPRRSRNLRSSSSSAPSSMSLTPHSAKRDRRALRMWFRQWKIFVRGRRERTRRRAAADALLKQKVITKWACFLKRRRYEHEKKRLLDAWKISRAISVWNQWKQRRIAVRGLLNGGRSSFMGRLSQQRVWRRWIHFSKRRLYVRGILLERIGFIHRRLLRAVWTELRIHAFRSRQTRQSLERCFRGMRKLHIIQQRQRVTCAQYQRKANLARRRELLHRWRSFAHSRCRDKRLAWRVQFDVSRRRFLLLWWEAACVSNRIARLREKVTYRSLRQHLVAWRTVTQAIRLGDRVAESREKDIRRVYFRALNDQTTFSALCRRVQVAVSHRRLSSAVAYLHAWTVEKKRRNERIHQIRSKWHNRLLRCAWVEGWLRLDHKRRAKKHARLALQVYHFKAWKRFHRAQQDTYIHEERAEVLHSKFCCQRSLSSWKIYRTMRLAHRQQLVKAQEYYQRRLLQRGVVILWSAVHQNAQNSQRGHHLRQKLRISAKKRHFCAWQVLTQSNRQLVERACVLHQSSGYRTSICNPSRRAWDRWAGFVALRKLRHRCDEMFQLRVKRQVVVNWHRQAQVETRCRVFGMRRSMKSIENMFACWKSRVEKWRKVGAICDLSERVYERKLCTRVMRDWRRWSSYHRRVRLCGGSIQRAREAKLQAKTFVVWHQQFHTRQSFAKLRCARQQRQKRLTFDSWHSHCLQQKAFARKLAHFNHVYGMYPKTSIVARIWCRWKQTAEQSRQVRVLHRKYLLRQACRCWTHWKIFHAACRALRVWRRVAVAMSSSNNKLGLRIRCFRESRHRALQRGVLDQWKRMVQRRRDLQDRQSLWKHQLNRELEGAHWSSQQAARFHLNCWFRRWRTAHNEDNNLAMEYYHTRLLRMVVRSWWKTTIHSKQERVLVQAQQTIGKLSYYHPQQQAYVAQARRSGNQTQRGKVPKRKLVPKNTVTCSVKAESMRNMRRMLDPTETQSYSRLYEEGGREISFEKPSKRTVAAPAVKPCCQNHRERTVLRRSLNDEAEVIRADDNYRGLARGTDDKSLRLQNVPMEAARSNPELLQPPHPDDPHLDMQHQLQQNRLAAFELENNSLRSQSMVAENELPLFDDEVLKLVADDSNRQVRYADLGDAPKQSVGLASSLHVERTVDKENSDGHQSGWAHLTASRLESQQTTPSITKRREYRAVQTVPTMFEPSQSLAPSIASSCGERKHTPRVTKTRSVDRRARVKVVRSSEAEERPLAAILALSDISRPNLSAEEGSADADIRSESEAEWDSSVIREVVGFYVDSIMSNGAGGDSNNDGTAKKKLTRLRACFRMVRDLALFQNDFYIDEMIKIYDANFRGDYFIADKREEQARLELFIEQLVENHPAYRKYVDLTLRKRTPRSPIPLCALNWLARHHLRPNLLLQKRARIRPRKNKKFWIWEQIPDDMDLALEKLLPAITKYMRVLGQFFLRQAAQSSSTTGKPQDYRMSSTAFISLMKQVRVFPQLFHRRELENAVRLSSCSSPESEELNFPEFIEALVRCSCTLRWGELNGSKPTADMNDTVVVIKFVMLIFAMEGQGTVLKKRNEDVGAILGFLGEQQRKKQAEKMIRFRKMLSDNKRRVRASRKHQIPSVWNQVRLQFSPTSSPARSPTRSHDTFDELTESWDGGSPRRISTEPFVFDAQTNQPFGLEVSPSSKSVESRDGQDNDQHRVDTAEYVTEERDPLFNVTGGGIDEGNCNSPSRGDTPSAPTKQVIDTNSSYAEPSAEVTLAQLSSAEAIPAESKGTFDGEPVNSVNAGDDVAEAAETIPVQSSGLAEPMEKDEFLREILDSIGDVELMLNQPRFAGSNFPKSGKRHLQRTPSSASMVSTQSTPSRVQAASVDFIPSLNDLAAGSLSYSCSDWRTPGDSAGLDSEIPVRDPMLNYLTDVERFTESTDKTSLVAIADLSGLPFEAVLPSQCTSNRSSDTWAAQGLRPTEEVTANTAPEPRADES